MSDFSNQTIRGYEFIERIGRGGFADVYRARQKEIDREVAIKIITPEMADTPDFYQNFQVEANLIARLEHPNIVPIYDLWREGDNAFLVMRLLPGGSLRDRIKQGKIDPETVAKLFQQIASGLDFAHNHGIVHRDIKPENIMFDNNDVPYLTDFGLAKPIGYEDPDSDDVSGTLMYMSPEQLTGLPPTPASDMYSIGIMLYEMLLGRHPLLGLSTTEIMLKQMREPLPSITDRLPGVSELVNLVIQRLTDKDHTLRYDTLADAVYELYEALNLSGGEMATAQPLAGDQGGLIQQIISDNIADLERRLFDLYERVATEQNVDLQTEVERIRLQKSFRVDSLERLTTHLPPTIPTTLQIPAPPKHDIIHIQANFDRAKGAILNHTSIVLVGPTGVGKSVLANSLGQHDDIKQAYVDRIIYLQFGNEPDLNMAVADLLLTYGFDQDLSEISELDDRLYVLEDFITAPLLIIADDVRHADHLLDTFASMQVPITFIVTTRLTDVAFDLDFDIINVEDFDLETRLQFLNSLLPDIDLNLFADEARIFLNKVGGLPGDIQLIGSKLKRARNNPRRLISEMERIETQLTDALETSFELFKLNLDELDEDIRDSLRNLVILPAEPSTFSEQAGEAIAQSVNYLYDLVDASLLKNLVNLPESTSNEQRFALYPTFAEFTRQYLPPDTEAYQRAVDYFMDYIREHNADFPDLSGERANLEAVLEIALQQSFASQFVECVLLLHPYWLGLGMIERAEHYAIEALRLVDKASISTEQQAKLLLHRANIASTRGDIEDSTSFVTQGLQRLSDGDDVKTRASLLIQQGRLLFEIGEYEQSVSVLESAQALLKPLNDHRQLAEISSILGSATIYSTGDVERTLEHYNDSLYQAQLADNKYRMSNVLVYMGTLKWQFLQDNQGAISDLSKALTYAQDINHAETISHCLITRGLIEMTSGNRDAARNFYEEAVVQAKRSHSAKFIAAAQLMLGVFHTESGEFTEAEQQFATALDKIKHTEDPVLMRDLVDYLFKNGANRIKQQQLDFDVLTWDKVAQAINSFALSEETITRFYTTHQRLINKHETQGSHEAMFEACYQIGLLERDDFNDAQLALTHFTDGMRHARLLGRASRLIDGYVASIETLIMLEQFERAETLLAQFMTAPVLQDEPLAEHITPLLTSILDAREESSATEIHQDTWRTLNKLLPKRSDDNVQQKRLEQLFELWSA